MGVWLKRLGLVALVAAVVAGFYYALREKPALVDVGTVERGPMTVSILQEGMARVRNVYTVSSPIAGNLSRTTLEEGDKVEANRTVVASIRPLPPPLIDRRTQAELVAAREAARAAVAIAEVEEQRARTAFDLAKTEYERAQRLASTGIVPEQTLQKASSEFALQQAQVKAAEATIRLRRAELASAEARLMQTGEARQDNRVEEDCCVEVTAPIDGVVLAVFAESEQAVTAGAKIAEIGDPADIEIVADLLSTDAVRIEPGTKATITDWGGGRPIPATVRRIDPAAFTKVSALGIEEQRVNVVLDLDEPEHRLGHNYRVFVEVAVWRSDDAVQVPLSALFRVGRQWNVFRVEGDRVSQVPVSVGQMNSSRAELLEGLEPGATVVTHPSDTLEDGSLVEPRPETE